MSNRTVNDSFWTDPYIEKLDPTEKLCFLYLLTNPLSNIAGVYEIRTKRMAFETGFDMEVIETILGRFEKDRKIIKKDNWIIIINHKKHQSYKNPSVDAGIQRILNELPKEIFTLYIELSKVKLSKVKLSKVKLSKVNETVPSVYTDCIQPVPSVYTDCIQSVKKSIYPTFEEVKKYCEEDRKNDVDYKKFYDYYSTSDWKDKDGKQVKNWKQKVITWEGRKNDKYQIKV